MSGLHCIIQGLSLLCVDSIGRVNSVAAEVGLNCSQACGVLVPWSGTEPMSPALQGRFLTTDHQEIPCYIHFNLFNFLVPFHFICSCAITKLFAITFANKKWFNETVNIILIFIMLIIVMFNLQFCVILIQLFK